MNESTRGLHPWQYGMHPRAIGAQVQSLGRVDLPLGEGMRLEMVDAEPGEDDRVYVQYYIATGPGPWAIWLSCPRQDLARHEATLRAFDPAEEAS